MLRRPDDLNLDGDNPKDDDDEDENVDGSEDPFDIDSQLKETEEEEQKGEDDSADKKQEEEEMGQSKRKSLFLKVIAAAINPLL